MSKAALAAGARLVCPIADEGERRHWESAQAPGSEMRVRRNCEILIPAPD
jgi:hypothetical protein